MSGEATGTRSPQGSSSLVRLFGAVDVCSVWIRFLEVGDVVGLSMTCKAAHRLCGPSNKAVWVPLVLRLMLDAVGPAHLSNPDSTLAAAAAASASLESSSFPSEQRSSHRSCYSPVRDILVGSQALAMAYLSLLRRSIAQTLQKLHNTHSLADSTELHKLWPRSLAIALSALGFETFSFQARTLRKMVSSLSPPSSQCGDSASPPHCDGHSATGSSSTSNISVTPMGGGEPQYNSPAGRTSLRVLEQFMLVLSHYQSMQSTSISDVEGVQEIVSVMGSSMESAVENLKPMYKALSKQQHTKQLSRVVLELKRQCFSVSNCIAVAAQLAEINDHPNAQAKYDSLWAVYRAVGNDVIHSTRGMQRDANHALTSTVPHRPPTDSTSPLPVLLDPVSMIMLIPLEDSKYSSCLTCAQLRRLHRIHSVRVADILDYFLRMPKKEQDCFVANVRSLYRLTIAGLDL